MKIYGIIDPRVTQEKCLVYLLCRRRRRAKIWYKPKFWELLFFIGGCRFNSRTSGQPTPEDIDLTLTLDPRPMATTSTSRLGRIWPHTRPTRKRWTTWPDTSDSCRGGRGHRPEFTSTVLGSVFMRQTDSWRGRGRGYWSRLRVVTPGVVFGRVGSGRNGGWEGSVSCVGSQDP